MPGYRQDSDVAADPPAADSAEDAILVVDDNPWLLRLVGLVLGLSGYIVVSAESGPRALALLETLHPSLIVLDLAMPEMDGEMLFNRVRHEGYDGPVLVLSASPSVRLQSARMGVPFIRKPFDPAHLVEVVDELAGQTARHR